MASPTCSFTLTSYRLIIIQLMIFCLFCVGGILRFLAGKIIPLSRSWHWLLPHFIWLETLVTNPHVWTLICLLCAGCRYYESSSLTPKYLAAPRCLFPGWRTRLTRYWMASSCVLLVDSVIKIMGSELAGQVLQYWMSSWNNKPWASCKAAADVHISDTDRDVCKDGFVAMSWSAQPSTPV